ncbi:MAG: FAD-dependent oxidoreductase [candidate division WOR-3 bacterium]|nr:MAG: FAD-dependent oxidoreductase [candidate division WOR-3 bacterium]
MPSNTKYGRATLISALFVGGGQIYSRRYWAGLVFACLFYGSIGLMLVIWTGVNEAFWGLIAAWILVWLYNVYDAFKGANYHKPPCEKSCPAGISPWIYINLIAADNDEKYPHVPFFGTLEHICPAPCEDECTRRGIDSAVAIKYLKRCVSMEEPPTIERKRKEKIAIIGAGPCGLSAAYSLSNKGYDITVYEREEKPGGILTTLIPSFRLPDAMLNEEIENMLRERVELKCGIEVGKDTEFEDILREYDAVFVAIGAWKATTLGIPGEENALSGFDVLRKIKEGKTFKLGRVGVIGGGNTAIDVARSLLRQGNEVSIYYRRRIMDMPAEHEDRIEAQEEGIEIVQLTTPLEIHKDRVTMTKTECLEGRAGAVGLVKGSEYEVEIDALVITAGQWPESSFLKDHLKTDKRGRIVTKNGKTSHPKVFAGGDAVLGSATVAHAVGQGLAVADRIDAHLRKVPGFIYNILRRDFLPAIKLIPMRKAQRIEIPHRKIEERIKDFAEVELDASNEDLRNEACRCLTCPLKFRP